MDLDSCQIIVKKLARANAGLAMKRLSLSSSFECTKHINPLPRVFHGLPEDRVVYQLVYVLLKVAGGLLSELCIHPDVWLHPSALVEPDLAMDFGQTHAQRRE